MHCDCYWVQQWLLGNGSVFIPPYVLCVCVFVRCVSVCVSYRHCGYSKAFQDSDEEKMHYQNGHGRSRLVFNYQQLRIIFLTHHIPPHWGPVFHAHVIKFVLWANSRRCSLHDVFPPLLSAIQPRSSDAMSLSFPGTWLNADVVCLSVVPRCKVLHRSAHLRGPLPGRPRVCQRNWGLQDQNRENHRFR